MSSQSNKQNKKTLAKKQRNGIQSQLKTVEAHVTPRVFLFMIRH
jgi:translation initiation factor IF-2